jgi:Na+-transporting NADH:ubiquinone oxidoreductase subunit NqrC
MSLAKRLYPRTEDSKRRRQFRAFQTAVILGLICSVLVAAILYGIYWIQNKH